MKTVYDNYRGKGMPNLIKFLRDAASGSLTCVHNHPGSSSFSPEDLNVMCAFNSIDCMRVIAHDGTRYFAEVGNGQRVSLPTIKKLYDFSYNFKVKFQYEQPQEHHS